MLIGGVAGCWFLVPGWPAFELDAVNKNSGEVFMVIGFPVIHLVVQFCIDI